MTSTQRFEYTPFVYQKGGSIDGYTGYKYYPRQIGNGWGDVFRSVMRFMAPIGIDAAGSFFNNLNRRHDEGLPWKQAAKRATGDAIMSAVTDVAEKLQTGKGRKRRKSSPKRKSAKVARTKIRKQTQKPRKKRKSAPRSRVGYKKAPVSGSEFYNF